MSKRRSIILSVTVEGLSQAEAARLYGVSRGWVSKLMARYRAEGEEAFEPRSRRPHTSPNATPTETVEAILELRRTLTEQGLDAGPETSSSLPNSHRRSHRTTATPDSWIFLPR